MFAIEIVPILLAILEILVNNVSLFILCDEEVPVLFPILGGDDKLLERGLFTALFILIFTLGLGVFSSLPEPCCGLAMLFVNVLFETLFGVVELLDNNCDKF